MVHLDKYGYNSVLCHMGPPTHSGEVLRVVNPPHNARTRAGWVHQDVCDIRVVLRVNLYTDTYMSYAHIHIYIHTWSVVYTEIHRHVLCTHMDILLRECVHTCIKSNCNRHELGLGALYTGRHSQFNVGLRTTLFSVGVQLVVHQNCLAEQKPPALLTMETDNATTRA